MKVETQHLNNTISILGSWSYSVDDCLSFWNLSLSSFVFYADENLFVCENAYAVLWIFVENVQ